MRPAVRLALALPLVPVALPATSLLREAAARPPTAPFQRIWGTLWYLRSMAEIDDLSLVYGGVEGSSVLVYRDYGTGKSHWVYLEGNNPLFVAFGQGLAIDEFSRGRMVATDKELREERDGVRELI